MELDKRICKTCKQIKTRIRQEKYNDQKNYKYRDENGKLWLGNLCPSCNNERLKNVMKEKRNAKKTLVP